MIQIRGPRQLSHLLDIEQTDRMLCLAIHGFDADPSLVTQILGLEPTVVALKGQVSRSGRNHKANAWWLEAHPPKLIDGVQHNTALNLLIDAFRERAGQFRELRERLNPTSISIYGGLYHKPDVQCSVWLEPEQMEVLAACGIGWGLDVFTDADQ